MQASEPSFTPTVMLVDDEEMVVAALRSVLRMHSNYRILAYTSSRHALQDAPNHEVDVIVSDLLMPEMDGISLLRELKPIHPMAARILLTGYGDKQSAIRAINDVGIYQYLEKPWDNEAIRLIIRNAVERRMLQRSLEQKVSELGMAQTNLASIRTELIRAFS